MADTRITATAPVSGVDYDELVEDGRAHARALLGPDRNYWLEITDVEPATDFTSGADLWVGSATIVAPYDAVEF